MCHLVSPSITKPPAKEVEVKEGELLTLLCTVVGNPLPSVTWLRINNVCDEERRPPISDDKVTFDNSTSTSNLTIRVGREDSGHYFCGVANVLSKPSVVFVLGKYANETITVTNENKLQCYFFVACICKDYYIMSCR